MYHIILKSKKKKKNLFQSKKTILSNNFEAGPKLLWNAFLSNFFSLLFTQNKKKNLLVFTW